MGSHLARPRCWVCTNSVLSPPLPSLSLTDPDEGLSSSVICTPSVPPLTSESGRRAAEQGMKLRPERFTATSRQGWYTQSQARALTQAAFCYKPRTPRNGFLCSLNKMGSAPRNSSLMYPTSIIYCVSGMTVRAKPQRSQGQTSRLKSRNEDIFFLCHHGMLGDILETHKCRRYRVCIRESAPACQGGAGQRREGLGREAAAGRGAQDCEALLGTAWGLFTALLTVPHRAWRRGESKLSVPCGWRDKPRC